MSDGQLSRDAEGWVQPPGGQWVVNPETKSPWWAKILLTLAVLAVLVPTVGAFVKVPYAVLSPGPITDVLGSSDGKKVLSISGATLYKPGGKLYSTSVYVGGGPGDETTALDAFVAWARPSVAVFPVEQIFPKGSSAKDVTEENTAEMVDSQEEATAVALTHLGYKVTQRVTIADLPDGSPAGAAGVTKGDQIVAVDGTAITTIDQIRPAVQQHEAGDKVALTLVRAGKKVTADVTTKDVQGKPTLGVYLALAFDAPVKVTYNMGDTGGPSAGLMFSLAVYDELTPGDLPGTVPVAGTGTIDYLGHVGAIGGIVQKMAGAHNRGVDWFLAPADNCDEVVGHVPGGLHVVKVASFDEALAAVKAIASKSATSLPSCTAG